MNSEFDTIRTINLENKGFIPNPKKYPFADRIFRMYNQFGDSHTPAEGSDSSPTVGKPTKEAERPDQSEPIQHTIFEQ